MQPSGIHKTDIIALFDGELHPSSRYFYPPASNESTESMIVGRFNSMKQEYGSITLVDGAFDVPHNNHEWYLRHCKLLGAYVASRTIHGHGSDIAIDEFKDHLTQDPRIFTRHKLAVTLDADVKIAQKKSGLDEKGGIERPVYPWQARADRLAGYHFTFDDLMHQTVDLVTVEGDSIHSGTPLESSLALAAFLKTEDLLDTFIVYGEHSSTIDEADALRLNPIVITDDVPYEKNPQTNQTWSSSSLVRRAQGEPVDSPINRPSSAMVK